MKIALLSGADKNAGDFLIVKRADALIRHQFPQAEIRHFQRNQSLQPYLNEINSYDYLIFAGGPGYVENMYPERFPLVEDLDQIVPRIVALGMGCYGRTASTAPLKFNDSTKRLINRIQDDGLGFGCRDYLSYKRLKASGIDSVLMTGCPAWYDLDYLDIDEVINPVPVSEVKKIAVSDPAVGYNLETAKDLISELRVQFPSAEIVVAFHRGWNVDSYTDYNSAQFQSNLHDWCRNNDIEVRDIAYASEGFSVYDECDFHIGFRVHAHIYSLSHRRPTFLIEEDGRGFGVNEALGLTHQSLMRSSAACMLLDVVRAMPIWQKRINAKQERRLVGKTVNHAMEEIKSGYPELLEAYKKMQKAYGAMLKQLSGLS